MALRTTTIDMPATRSSSALVLGIGLVALVHVLTAAMILIAPHTFYEHVGPFGTYNGHYLRDAAAFEGGVGLALLAAVRWPALRAGALAAAAAVGGLHAINHWADVNAARFGSSAGWGDAISLSILAVFTAVLLRAALRRPA